MAGGGRGYAAALGVTEEEKNQRRLHGSSVEDQAPRRDTVS
jgi:hypothetical protein